MHGRDVKVQLRGLRRGVEMIRAGGTQHVIIDVDGCLTSGLQLVDPRGEKIKAFGLDDRAAIEVFTAMTSAKVTLITSDFCDATVKRAQSWGVHLVKAPASPLRRIFAMKDLAGDLSRVVYIGDGYYDARLMHQVGFGIAPADAWPPTRRAADAVTSLPGGRRAVAQALDFTRKWFA